MLRTFLAVAALAAAIGAEAQYSAPALRAQVVDAATREPVEGAVILARWEWLDYRPTIHGSQFVNNGDALHVAEALTGRDGRFEIAGWIAVAKLGGGHPDSHFDPKIAIFKSGYAPLVLRNQAWTDYMHDNPARRRDSEWNGKTIELRKYDGAAKDYAALIRKFQGEWREGLWWQENPKPDSMPRMVMALHREKARLADDGYAILGANLLPGRNGEGSVLDADTGKPVWPAIVSITWTMRREGGTQTRTLVQQKRGGVEGSSERFYVSPWRLPAPALAGFEVAYDRAPLVRVYAKGYRRSEDVAWKGGEIRLRKLPENRDAQLEELRSWRRDVDAALAQSANRDEGLEGQWLLISSLENECRTLTGDLHAGLCFTPDSELGRFAAKVRSEQRGTWETAEGSRPQRIVAVGGTRAVSAISAQSVAVPGVPMAGFAGASGARIVSGGIYAGGPPDVRGFSIEPRKP